MEIKREFKYFTVFNHEAEEAYLRQMHLSGWRFTKVTGLGLYHFEKCQPEDVVYQLDYNQEGSSDKAEYIRMFADCGWNYIQEYVGYSYFSKPAAEMNGEEEIFSDDSSRLAMMDRVFKKRMIPLMVIFCAVILPMFIMLLIKNRFVLAAMYGAILVLYIVVFCRCAVSYHRQKYKE